MARHIFDILGCYSCKSEDSAQKIISYENSEFLRYFYAQVSKTFSLQFFKYIQKLTLICRWLFYLHFKKIA